MALQDILTLVRSRPWLVAVVAVPLVGVAIAVPALVGSDAGPEPGPTSQAPEPPPAVVEDDGPSGQDVAPSPDTTGRQPHADGDLDISIGVRFERYPQGARIRANVEVVNMSLEPFYLPAPAEPQPTLTVLVLDEEGQTVRRVVEATDDTTPRRMRRLASGESSRFRIDVVTREEEALPPGTYHLVASYGSDDGWLRSGLPIWTAPKGVRHSDSVSLEVTPAQ